ncbi:hypothetical protein EON80_30340, partial [bacterium]
MPSWTIKELVSYIGTLADKIQNDSATPKGQRRGRVSGSLQIGILALLGVALLGLLTMSVLLNAGFSFRTMGRIGENLQ